MTAPVEWRFPGDEEWQTGVLNGRDDYTEQIMNLDGPCGGYNLQWSFASGYLAGMLKS